MFAAWFARIHLPAKDGSIPRDSLEAAANNPRHRSHASALRTLEGPPFPVDVAYLWDWLMDIRRGLGYGMDGLNALTWTVLDAWSRMTGNKLDPDEASALLSLDAVMRSPESLGEAAWT